MVFCIRNKWKFLDLLWQSAQVDPILSATTFALLLFLPCPYAVATADTFLFNCFPLPPPPQSFLCTALGPLGPLSAPPLAHAQTAGTVPWNPEGSRVFRAQCAAWSVVDIEYVSVLGEILLRCLDLMFLLSAVELEHLSWIKQATMSPIVFLIHIRVFVYLSISKILYHLSIFKKYGKCTFCSLHI